MASTPPTTMRSCMRMDRGKDPACMLESDFVLFEDILTVLVAIV